MIENRFPHVSVASSCLQNHPVFYRIEVRFHDLLFLTTAIYICLELFRLSRKGPFDTWV